MKTISDEVYTRLIRAERMLNALYECGVEEWEDYQEAVKIAFPDEDED
jgi:hypothetical protein